MDKTISSKKYESSTYIRMLEAENIRLKKKILTLEKKLDQQGTKKCNQIALELGKKDG